MARAKVEWSVLRGALSVFAICFLLSGIMLGASYYFRDEMNSEFQKNQVRFKNVSRKYLAVDEEERIIRTMYPHFIELYNRGIIGRESRLDWLETLRRAGEEIKIPDLRYSVDAREQFEPDFPVATGAFSIFASTMELELGLMHEGDFAALMEKLDRNAHGLFDIDKCLFRRLPTGAVGRSDQPNLSASCDLLWFTVSLSGKELVL